LEKNSVGWRFCGCISFTASGALHPGGQQWKSSPFPLPKKLSLSQPALQQKYYSVNTMALGMSVEEVKKPKVKRKA